MSAPAPNTRVLFWVFLGLIALAGAIAAWNSKRDEFSIPMNSNDASAAVPIPGFSDTIYRNVGPEAEYIGSSACGKCHADNEKSYLLTPHSRAFSTVDPKNEPEDGSYLHLASGRIYRVYRKEGQLHHEEIMRSVEGKEITHQDFPVRYLVGSGHYSRTYLLEIDGFLHESPITWYAQKKKWDMSPGYDARHHWGFERAAEIRCLRCHAGRVEEAGAVHRMTFHEMAVGCENCHGPGGMHQALHTNGRPPGGDDLTIVNPRKASRVIEESICASCHESGIASIDIRGRQGGEFRPGRPLSDYRIHYRFTGDHQPMNVVGHVEQLHQSSCYLKSERLSCLSCHDPHRCEEIKDKAAYYREKCETCHKKQPCKLDLMQRQKKESNNCVACHMPSGDTDIPHIAFTHHRIGLHGGKLPEIGNKIPILAPGNEGVDNLSPLDRQRNLGLAYSDIYRNPQYASFARIFRRKAIEQLESVYAAGLRDADAMIQLAEIHSTNSEFTRARQLAEEVLAAKDVSSNARARALLVLADSERESGDLPAAIVHLEEATRLRRSDDNWRLLGLSYLENGQVDRALPALQNALSIRPYEADTQSALAEIFRLKGNLSLSQDHAEKALWLRNHK